MSTCTSFVTHSVSVYVFQFLDMSTKLLCTLSRGEDVITYRPLVTDHEFSNANSCLG